MAKVGRKPGTKRTGGRVKGTPNKKTQALIDRCGELGFDPWEALLSFAQDPLADLKLRFDATKEICSYVYPKRKAVEVEHGDQKHVHTLSDEVAKMVSGWLSAAKAERK